MEVFFNVVWESFLATITSPILVCVVLGILVIVAILFYIDKRKSSVNNFESFDLGLNKSNEEHLGELEEIKKLMSSGSNKPIEVNAVNALYIARHFDQYNLLSSEKGTVVFERLLQVSDTIEATLQEEQLEVGKNKQPSIQNIEVLSNGDVRLMRDEGYTLFRDGLIVGSKVFEDGEEQKKKQASSTKSAPPSKQIKQDEVMKVSNALREDIIVFPSKRDEQKNNPSSAPVINELENNLHETLEENKVKNIESLLEEDIERRAIGEQSEISLDAEESDEQKNIQSSWVGQVINRAKGNEKFNCDNPIIDTNNLAAIVSGKPIKNKQPKKEIQNFEPLYLYENKEDFFRIAFLSEPEETSFEKKIIKFLSFVIQHETVFLSEGDKRLYVHIDSMILSFARTMIKESRASFLKAIYDESGSFSNRAFANFMHQFSKKIELYCEKSFIMWWKPQQLDYRSCIFPRVIKQQAKVSKGEFVVLNFKDTEFLNIIFSLEVSTINDATVLGSSVAEFEAISGKKLKIRSLQEMTDVL